MEEMLLTCLEYVSYSLPSVMTNDKFRHTDTSVFDLLEITGFLQLPSRDLLTNW